MTLAHTAPKNPKPNAWLDPTPETWKQQLIPAVVKEVSPAYTYHISSSDECVICKETLENSVFAHRPPQGKDPHCMHFECFEKWKNSLNKEQMKDPCPLRCGYQLKKEEELTPDMKRKNKIKEVTADIFGEILGTVVHQSLSDAGHSTVTAFIAYLIVQDSTSASLRKLLKFKPEEKPHREVSKAIEDLSRATLIFWGCRYVVNKTVAATTLPSYSYIEPLSNTTSPNQLNKRIEVAVTASIAKSVLENTCDAFLPELHLPPGWFASFGQWLNR